MRSIQKPCMSFIMIVVITFIVLISMKIQGTPFTDLAILKKIKFKFQKTDDLHINLTSRWNNTVKSTYFLWTSHMTSTTGDIVTSPDTKNIKESRNLSDEITVLTAYFNIGSFAKGHPGNMYTPEKYNKWMSVFGRIKNNLVAFTDSNRTYQLLQRFRSKFPENQTKLFLIDRKELWSFQIEKNISNIFQQPGYPKHYPNTVLPTYSCAMHAKFELLARVIKNNYFNTKYFMWLDIGLFRDLTGEYEFGMSVPKDFNDSMVAYSHVFGFKKNIKYKDIVYKNLVWVGGASNLGKDEVLYRFTQEYLNFVKKSLSMNLMNTDQQIIYGMYADKNKPKTELQLYRTGWFKLGYVCYEAWKETH